MCSLTGQGPVGLHSLICRPRGRVFKLLPCVKHRVGLLNVAEPKRCVLVSGWWV